MKPARFDYVRVDTLDEAADILAQSGDDARVLAGGQSLMAMMNMRLAQPAVVVDILHATGPRSPEVARRHSPPVPASRTRCRCWRRLRRGSAISRQGCVARSAGR
jgi:hypothetical protein